VLGKNDEICNITAKSDGVVNENCDINWTQNLNTGTGVKVVCDLYNI
jgi:hypothetical protein